METSLNAPDPDRPSLRQAANVSPLPTPPSRWDLARRRLGLMLNDKWHLDELLGVGGMAAVYAATHRNGSRVAIKLLPFSLATGPEVCQRLLREGYLANRISHPAVVRVLDDHIDYEREHAYLVMDLLDGETARQRFDAIGTFDVVTALDLTIELADCLQAAHAANIIHRDIKPENLFLTRDGLKVLDFGIARALDGNSSLTQTGTSLGTPAYMSPEQARGKQAELSVRSDIYSVGATLFFLLTGETLHTGENPMELMVKVAWTPTPPVLSLCPNLPEAVAVMIDRCCAFESAERYPDATTLKQALEEARALLNTTGRPPSIRWSVAPASVRPNALSPSTPPDAETVGLPGTQNRSSRWLVASVALFTLLGSGLWLNHRARSRLPATKAPQATTLAAAEHTPAPPSPLGGLGALPKTAPEPAPPAPPLAAEAAATPLLAASAMPAPSVVTQASLATSRPGPASSNVADAPRKTADHGSRRPNVSTPIDTNAPRSANFEDARGTQAAGAPPVPPTDPATGKKGLGPLSYRRFGKDQAPDAP
jgi:eukaryotic-like serine/threonine-protein kinase